MRFLLDDRLVTAVYRAVPFIPGIYSVGAYVVARRSSRRIVWIIGLLIAAGLTAFTTVASLESGFALPRLLAAWTPLYALPMVLALATVDGSRRMKLPRWVGVLAIVAVCVVAQFIVRYVPFGFLDLVEATG
jgi:drug/metabolite transporter superfamily protein YnfA